MTNNLKILFLIIYLILGIFAFSHCHQRHVFQWKDGTEDSRTEVTAAIAGIFWPFYLTGAIAFPLTAPESKP